MDDPIEAPSARREWKEGWPVVLAGLVGMSAPAILVYTMGLFVAPLQAEFGWSRSQITFGLMINAVMAVLLSPIVGMMVDRYGSRRIGLPGMVIFLATFAALSLAGRDVITWWGLWLLLACVSLLVKPTVWTTAVASRFEASRGLAMAVMLCGSGLASIAGPSIGGFLLSEYGWRTAYVGIAAIWALFTLPLLFLFFYGASDLDRRGRGTKAVRAKPAALSGVGVKEVILSPTYLKLALSVFLVSLVLTGVLVHFVPLLVSLGRSQADAAAIASLIGLATIGGRVFTGSLLDRFNGAIIGATAFFLPVGAFAWLLVLDFAGWQALIIAIVIGLSVGAELEIAAFLVARHFGMYRFATLFAIMAALLAAATGLGPLLASLVYDNFGSYDYALWMAIPASLVATLLMATLGEYPRTDTQRH